MVSCVLIVKCWVFECLFSFLSNMVYPNTAYDQKKELLAKKYDEFKHGLKAFEDCCYILVYDQIECLEEYAYLYWPK